ncbi:MAG TPA: imidazolonepropionase [Candidatus Thermoplasmatota archaeon]|nr:imidazolonepropionase [Candidatus Thermoplasmatota archaeon]
MANPAGGKRHETDYDLVVRRATVATLDGPAGARDAAQANDCALEAGWTVAIKGGRIAWVGPDPDFRGSAATSLDAKRRLVTPGYVDSHTHLVYAGDRSRELKDKLQGKSYLEILAKGGGIMETVRATREASDNELEEQSLARLRHMVHNGTTTLESKSGYGLDKTTELRMLDCNPRLSKKTGVAIVSTFLGAHAVPDEYKGRSDAYVDFVVDEVLPAVQAQEVARFCDVFVEKDVFTVEQGERILRKAKELGFQLKVHADEIVNTGGAELAGRVNALTADHLLQVSETGVQSLVETGTIATLLPSVPLTMMKPLWAPAKTLLSAGVPVAVATDHNPNNPVLSLQLAAQLACYAMGLTPAQALTAVTWNAAEALDVERHVGGLQVGKVANLLIHDVPSLERWIYDLGRTTATHVILNGKLVPRA